MRINQYLARCGVASRRKAEELVKAGKVTVNGEVITELATQVSSADKVELEGLILTLPKLEYYLLNKPAGYTVSRQDIHAEKSVFELLPEDPSLFAVGRLDRETTGLIIITNDGQFGQNLIHPSKKIQKVYQATLDRQINIEDADRLRTGISLEDGPAKAKELTYSGNKVEITVEEGRNRLVRRMFDAAGYKVLELSRVRLGDLKLDVRAGEFRKLTEDEIKKYA